MKFNNYIINENLVDKVKDSLKRMNFKKLKSFLEGEFQKFTDAVMSAGLEPQVIKVINRQFETNYKSLDQIKKQRIRESEELNEDIAHWWDLFKTEAFPTLAFYPALTVWLEIDKIFQGQDIDMKKTIVYSMFWVLLVSGKYVKGWMKWKKENPDEYAKERAQGKGGYRIMELLDKISIYINEGKGDYKVYHNSYSSAADEIKAFAKKNGYTLDDESDPENIGSQMFDVVGAGPKKPSKGKTNRLNFKLYKNNKEQKKMLHAQVYGMDDGKYELNMYIN